MDGDWKERWAKDEAEIHQLIFLFVHFHCTHLPSIAEVTDASRWDFFSAFRPMMWRDEKRFAFAGFQKACGTVIFDSDRKPQFSSLIPEFRPCRGLSGSGFGIVDPGPISAIALLDYAKSSL